MLGSHVHVTSCTTRMLDDNQLIVCLALIVRADNWV